MLRGLAALAVTGAILGAVGLAAGPSQAQRPERSQATITQASKLPAVESDPLACIRVARDIHEYSQWLRLLERHGETTERRQAVERLWRAFERSEAYQFRNDLDAWDFYWTEFCYDRVIRLWHGF